MHILRRALTVITAAVALGLGASTALGAVQVPWATQAVLGSSSHYGYGNAISTLPDGSSIVTGSFEGTATFGSTTLTSTGSGSDVFVAKVDPSGAYVWARKAGGSASDAGSAISTLADGSAIVTGYFQGTATFGSTTPLTGAGNLNVFVAKVDPSGTWVWATRAPANSGQDVDSYGVSALPDGSAIVTGTFDDEATFGSTTLISGGGYDVFVAKMDASGAWVWARQAGGGSGDDYGDGVSTLPDGSSIVTGSFEGTATFGSTTLTSTGTDDVFIAKVDPSGTWVWATPAGGSGSDYGRGVSTLPDGSAIVTGQFRGTATFGTTTLTGAAGSRDVFVAKIDALGAWVWATGAGGNSTEEGRAISAMPDGSSIVTGRFQGTATFGSTTLTSAGGFDVFVANVDPSGAYVWATQAGDSSGDDQGSAVSTLPDGSAIVTGDFQGIATFGNTTLTNAGNQDVFVAKFLDAPQAPAAPQAAAGDGQATVTVTPLAGGSVTTYSVLASPSGRTCTITVPATSCTVSGLANGARYTFTATATNAAGTSPASAPSNAVTPAGTAATPTATTTTLRSTVLPSRARLTSGQAMRLGIRTTNTGTATAASVTSCLRVPQNLVVTRTGGATRSGRTLCFSLGDLPAGATRTNVVVVRAVAARSVTRTVVGTVQSSATNPALTTTQSRAVRISPRTARIPVTG